MSRPNMTAGLSAPGRAAIPNRTLRTDRWWRYPLATAAVLTVVGGYLLYAVIAGNNYFAEPYLSPMYSPCLSGNCASGVGWGWFASIAPASPALIVILFPAAFRATCYYYRKAYYRSFFASPPACAVAEPAKRYRGESRLPFIIQNVHRYFWYIALLFAGVLTYDVVIAFRDTSGHWGHAGLGTLIMLINVVLIWLYTVSCHSCRHITGGRLKHFSRHPLRYRAWTWVSKLNTRHMQFAWASLVSIAITDLYIRLLAAGFFADPRFF
ncbi:MAG: hypothetical protein ACRDRL_21435 [Sciscionella sp.]